MAHTEGLTSRESPSTPLVGTHSGAATLEKSPAVSYEVKPVPTMQTSHRAQNLPRDLPVDFCSGFIHCIQMLKQLKCSSEIIER